MNGGFQRPISVGAALALHYRASGLPEDGGRSLPCWSPLSLGPLKIELPNFRWRKRALPAHDVHHVLTGYPCTVAGELQIAAWEFAAGGFPGVLSTLFCLPLIAIGAVAMPPHSFAAFVLGRNSRSLHATPITPRLVATDLAELRRLCIPSSRPVVRCSDRAAYIGVVACSAALLAAPLVLLALVSLRFV